MTVQQHFESNGSDAFIRGNHFRVILENRNVMKTVVTQDIRYTLAPGDIFSVNTSKYKVVRELLKNPQLGITKYQIQLVF